MRSDASVDKRACARAPHENEAHPRLRHILAQCLYSIRSDKVGEIYFFSYSSLLCIFRHVQREYYETLLINVFEKSLLCSLSLHLYL